MSGTAPGNGCPGSHLHSSKPLQTLQGTYHCPRFADKQTEAETKLVDQDPLQVREEGGL